MRSWLVLALVFAGAARAAGEDNAACLACHAEDALARGLPTSVHGKLACVQCHAALKGAELPHATPVPPPDCGSCHAAQGKDFAASLHGRAAARGDALAPRCSSCHGNHEILPVASPASAVAPLRVPFVCGSCHREGAPVQSQRAIHQSRILENYSESMHGEGLLKRGLRVTATCVSCHTAHRILPHTDPASSIARANVTGTCTRCHALIEEVHRKVINGKLWEQAPHQIPVCVDCHQPHKARKAYYDQGMANRDCLSCHAKAGLASAAGHPLTVAARELSSSMHRKVACAQCHTGVAPSRTRPCETVVKKVNCAICHDTTVREYRGGIHGRLSTGGEHNAPACADCHGTHGIKGRGETTSPTYPTNVPVLCASCHREGQKAALRYRGTEHSIPEHYTESIHGKGLLKSGLVVTAMCTSCHTAHGMRPAADPASSVNRNRVAETCGRCHRGVYERLQNSVHSPAVTRTAKPLPVCSDCHTAHTIRRTDLAGFRMEIMGRCGRCHLETAKSYFQTYHGKVSQLGYGKTAKCHDCHGSHDILPVTDPRSSLHRQHVVDTCKKCHPGATRRFAGYFTHATHHDAARYPWLFWSFWGMTALLIGTFSVGGLHTLLWIPRALQMRRANPPRASEAGETQFERFTPGQRLTHAVMVVSFLSLALTGMTLKFSYTGWAVALALLVGGFEAAGLIHRAAAITMILLFASHLVSLHRLTRERHGSWWALLTSPGTMLPTLKDLRDLIGTFAWFLGRGPRPRYGRWTYWEKFDYFAVFWGIAIIGASGLFLWFPQLFTRLLPGWLINVATVIHSDEALLAVGFIFTVHFFNTHFRPDKFPMDLVIFTGRVPVRELERDRPAEYEELVASGELARRLVGMPPPALVRAARIFGTIALVIGLALVVGIIYAMTVAYR